MKICILYILSIVLTIDSVFRFFRTHLNLGTFLMYAITACFWVYTLFNKQIDAFTSHGFGFVVKMLFIAGIILLVIFMFFVFVAGFTQKATGDEKVVIVLGAGVIGEKVSDMLARRLDSAYEFYKENKDITIVVTGGQGPQEIMPEAHAMQKYLIEKGVPKEQIIVEDKSTSTKENFMFAKELLLLNGIESDEKIAFATNHFHCYRSMQYAKAAGYNNVSTISSKTGFFSIAPSYIREVFAILHYWVFVK